MVLSKKNKELFLQYARAFEGIAASDDLSGETEENIYENEDIRIVRIVSYSSDSCRSIWYDQGEHEIVYIAQGEAELEFWGGQKVSLLTGENFYIRKRMRHRVSYTSSNPPCVWYCLFVKEPGAQAAE